MFHSRWRRSGYTLTVSGSYERDQLLYLEFWDDVYLFDALYEEQLEQVRANTQNDGRGANPMQPGG